jgi:hypothetical protein
VPSHVQRRWAASAEAIFQKPGGPRAAAEDLLLTLGRPCDGRKATPDPGERMQAAEGILWLCGDRRCRPFVSTAEVVRTLRLLMEVEGSEGVAAAAEYCLWGMVCSGGPLCGEVGPCPSALPASTSQCSVPHHPQHRHSALVGMGGRCCQSKYSSMQVTCKVLL